MAKIDALKEHAALLRTLFLMCGLIAGYIIYALAPNIDIAAITARQKFALVALLALVITALELVRRLNQISARIGAI